MGLCLYAHINNFRQKAYNNHRIYTKPLEIIIQKTIGNFVQVKELCLTTHSQETIHLLSSQSITIAFV